MNSRDDMTDINASPQSALENNQFDNEQFDMASIDITAATDTAQLPQPLQPPVQQATYKAHATDFIVNELLPLEFTGEGEHLWLHIQKSGMNTAYLAKLLSEWAEIPLRDVGYSGLKDRHALTTQWFSLRIPKNSCQRLSLHQSISEPMNRSRSSTSNGTTKAQSRHASRQSIYHHLA